MIRLMLVDDHGLIREGLNTLLTSASDIQMVATCAALKDAYQQLSIAQPHLILLPLRLLNDNLDAFVDSVRRDCPQAGILVLSHHDQEASVQQLFARGIKGYLANPMTADELIMAVRKVAAGVTYVSASVAKRLTMLRWQTSQKDASVSPFERLSPREKQYSRCLAEGKPALAISQEMSVTLKTVNTYRYRLFQKLGVTGEVEFIKLALQHGWLKKDAP